MNDAPPRTAFPSDALLLLVAWITGFISGVFWLFLGAAGVGMREYALGAWVLLMAVACFCAPFRAMGAKMARRRRSLIAWMIAPIVFSVIGFVPWVLLARFGIL
jgi:hypothetical protein